MPNATAEPAVNPATNKEEREWLRRIVKAHYFFLEWLSEEESSRAKNLIEARLNMAKAARIPAREVLQELFGDIWLLSDRDRCHCTQCALWRETKGVKGCKCYLCAIQVSRGRELG